MAVLYRAHFHSMELQMELTRRGVLFEITSGLRFFEQAHIKDVSAFLKWVANPRDEVAFKRHGEAAARRRTAQRGFAVDGVAAAVGNAQRPTPTPNVQQTPAAETQNAGGRISQRRTIQKVPASFRRRLRMMRRPSRCPRRLPIRGRGCRQSSNCSDR